MAEEIKSPNKDTSGQGVPEEKEVVIPEDQSLDQAAAEEAKKDAEAKVDANITKEDENLKDQLKGDEVSGDVLKPGHFAKGTTNGFSMTKTKAKTLTASYDVGEEPRLVSDVDAYEKNSEMAQHEYARVESAYTEESTPVIEAGEDACGIAREDEVYAKKSFTTTETFGGIHTKANLSDPKVRENGKIFVSGKHQLVLAGETYLRTTVSSDGTETHRGHDSYKRLMSGEPFLLNKFDEEGRLKTEFGLVRQGLYVVLGINPLCGGASTPADKVIGYAKRNGDGNDVTELIKVPITVASHEFFRVREITPVVDDVKSAIGDLAIFMTSDKVKMHLGKYEAIASTILRAEPQNEVANEFTDFVEYAPNFKRSTLLVADRKYISGKIKINNVEYTHVDLSCYNDVADTVRMFDQMNQSEIAFMFIRDNVNRIKDQLKFFRGYEGKLPNQPFWSAIFKADPSKDYGNIPTMKTIFGQYASSRAWDNPAKILYGLGLFWRDLQTFAEEFDGSKLLSEYLSKVGVLKETIDNLAEAMCMGKFTDTKATSADLIKMADKARVVVGFNPNDVISYGEQQRTLVKVPSGLFSVSKNDTAYSAIYYKPFISTGYVICGADMEHAPQRKFYFCSPKWIKALVNAFADQQFLELNFLRYSSAGKLQAESALAYWWDNSNHRIYGSNEGKFLPFVLDHYNTTWMDVVLMKALGHATNKELLAMEGSVAVDGLTRFNKLIEKIGATDILNDDRISVYDAYQKITQNDLLYPNINKMDSVDFEKLPYDYINRNPFAHQTLMLGKVKNGGSAINIACFAPTVTRRRVNDLRMYTCANANITCTFNDLADLLGLVYSGTLALIPVEGDEAFIFAKADSNGKPTDEILTLKNCLVEGLNGEIRIDAVNPAADAKMLGVNSEKPTESIFNKDNFEFVTHYDGFVPVLHKGIAIARGSSAGASLIGPDTQCQGFQLELHGYVEMPFGSHSGETAQEYDFKQTAPIIKFPDSGNLRNRIYKSNSKTSNNYYVGRVRNDQVLASSGVITDTVTESKYISKAAIPSLYGGKLLNFDFVTDYYYAGSEGSYVIQNGIAGINSGNNNKVAEAGAGSHILKIRSGEVLGMTQGMLMYQRQTVFAPGLAGGYDEYSIAPTTMANTRAKFEIENVMPNDAEFHDKSVLFAYSQPDLLTDISHTTILGGVDFVFGVANMAGSKDVFRYASNYNSVIGPAEGHSAKLGDVRIGATVKKLKPMEIEAVNDFYYRKGLNFRLPIISERCCFDVVWDSAGADDPTITAITHDARVEPAELRSRAYVNDYRDFIVQRAIESLHQMWEKTNVYKSAFAEKYYDKAE